MPRLRILSTPHEVRVARAPRNLFGVCGESVLILFITYALDQYLNRRAPMLSLLYASLGTLGCEIAASAIPPKYIYFDRRDQVLRAWPIGFLRRQLNFDMSCIEYRFEAARQLPFFSEVWFLKLRDPSGRWVRVMYSPRQEDLIDVAVDLQNLTPCENG